MIKSQHPHYRWKAFKPLTKLSHLVTFKHCHIKSFAYTCRMVIGGQSKRIYFFGAEIKELKRQRFPMKSVSACRQQWEAVFIQERAQTPAASASLGDTQGEQNIHFLFLGIFRQWSQLIVSPDKTSNICSPVSCYKLCQRRLQGEKNRINPFPKKKNLIHLSALITVSSEMHKTVILVATCDCRPT